jgi:hypothetical protein
MDKVFNDMAKTVQACLGNSQSAQITTNSIDMKLTKFIASKMKTSIELDGVSIEVPSPCELLKGNLNGQECNTTFFVQSVYL